MIYEEEIMNNIIIGLIILSALAFVLAIIGSVFTPGILGVSGEGYSRACSNLALIAIALGIWHNKRK
jgi:hypothetical protein